MKSLLILAVTGVLSLGSLVAVGSAEPQARFDTKRPPTPEGQITTEVKDPRHPDEPWTVTTFSLPDESSEAHVRRHLAMVEAVRQALR